VARSSAFGANPLMRLLFERRDYLVETFDIGGAHAMSHSTFQCG
jgi:hypothetical protein